MLQSESNPDKIFDLKRPFAQSGRLSMNFYVHLEYLDLYNYSRSKWCSPDYNNKNSNLDQPAGFLGMENFI